MKLRTTWSVLTLAAAGILFSCNKEETSVQPQNGTTTVSNGKVNLGSVSRDPKWRFSFHIDIYGGTRRHERENPGSGGGDPCSGRSFCIDAGSNLTVVDDNTTFTPAEFHYYGWIEKSTSGNIYKFGVDKSEITVATAALTFGDGTFVLDGDFNLPASTCGALGVSAIKLKQGVYTVTETADSYTFDIPAE